MLIKEVCTQCAVTKKAVEYYAEQGLIHPVILENGYRDFGSDDLERLKKIAILRKLGLGTEDIKLVLSDDNGQVLQKLSLKKELQLDRERIKQSLLDKLGTGKDWEEISAEINCIEQNETITEKLLDAFPGYYGRFISLHFSRFLNEPLTTFEQREAYNRIVVFLDNAPTMKFPKDLQEFLAESTKSISTQNIREMTESTKKSIDNPEKLFSDNKEMLEQYLVFKQSNEYKNSPVYKIQILLKEFNNTNGYYDVFIPAMKKLSTSYEAYYKQLEIANEKLLSQYPEIQKL